MVRCTSRRNETASLREWLRWKKGVGWGSEALPNGGAFGIEEKEVSVVS